MEVLSVMINLKTAVNHVRSVVRMLSMSVNHPPAIPPVVFHNVNQTAPAQNAAAMHASHAGGNGATVEGQRASTHVNVSTASAGAGPRICSHSPPG